MAAKPRLVGQYVFPWLAMQGPPSNTLLRFTDYIYYWCKVHRGRISFFSRAAPRRDCRWATARRGGRGRSVSRGSGALVPWTVLSCILREWSPFCSATVHIHVSELYLRWDDEMIWAKSSQLRFLLWYYIIWRSLLKTTVIQTPGAWAKVGSKRTSPTISRP